MAANLTRSESRVLINPAGPQLGTANAIIWGRARQYHVAEFPGPLSIKSVVHGSGIWETEEAERVVDTGSYLVLNAGRPYSITIDAREIVETFCLFFRPGFVEDVHRVESCDPVALLNEPFAAEQYDEKYAIANGNGRLREEFYETLQGHDALVSPLLKRIYARMRTGTATQEYLGDQFFAVARAMLRVRRRSKKQAERVPAKKLSTRLELYKRLLRGRDFLDSFRAEDLPLNEVAHAACVSPYHFHRLFREVFGETPNQYLQRKRLERARELLESTDRGVMEISMDVGFESSTSFSALFRRTFGCSPREYRSLPFRPARDAEKK